MRHAPRALLALSLALLLPGIADAQQSFRRVKIDRGDVQVGFQTVLRSSTTEGFKAGMWTPVLVKFNDDEDGNFRFPVEVDGSIGVMAISFGGLIPKFVSA